MSLRSAEVIRHKKFHFTIMESLLNLSDESRKWLSCRASKALNHAVASLLEMGLMLSCSIFCGCAICACMLAELDALSEGLPALVSAGGALGWRSGELCSLRPVPGGLEIMLLTWQSYELDDIFSFFFCGVDLVWLLGLTLGLGMIIKKFPRCCASLALHAVCHIALAKTYFDKLPAAIIPVKKEKIERQ